MKALGDFPLFSGVNTTVLDSLQKSCIFRNFDTVSKQTIVSSGDQCNGIWMMFGGKARKLLYAASGDTLCFGEINAKESFGEECMGSEWPYSVIAEKPSICLFMPKAVLIKALATTEIAERLMKTIAITTIANVTRIHDMTQYKSAERARREVIRRLKKGERFTHEEVSWSISTTRETVARVVGDMIREKILIKTGGHNGEARSGASYSLVSQELPESMALRRAHSRSSRCAELQLR